MEQEQPSTREDKMAGERKLKLRAKSQIVVDGVTRQAGEVFEMPEREALNLVGLGACEQIPAGVSGSTQAPGPEERTGTQSGPGQK